MFSSDAQVAEIHGAGNTLPDDVDAQSGGCPGPYDWRLEEFLHTYGVAFTPEVANVTMVVRAGVRHVLEVAWCQFRLAERVLHFWECVAQSIHIRHVSPDALLGGMRRNVLTLERALSHDVVAARPDPETLCRHLLSVADAALQLASASTDVTRRVYNTTAPMAYNDTNSTYGNSSYGNSSYGNSTKSAYGADVWVDTWCCALRRPEAMINSSLTCPPMHRRKSL